MATVLRDQRVESLMVAITYASKHYYSGNPIMTDSEFDELIRQLRELDPENELLSTPGTGFNPKDITHLKKYEHLTTVGSLDKIKHEDVINGLTKDFSEYFVASLKLDGGSAVAYYENGILLRVLSRGDGTIGLDITRNILASGTVPTEISDRSIVAVRGEVVMTYDSFDVLGGSSPRNRAVGLSQSVHARDDELSHLRFIAYDIPVKKSGSVVIDKIADFNKLEELGFLVVPWQIYNGWMTFVSDAIEGEIDLSVWNRLPDVLENRFSRGTFRENVPVDGLVLTKPEYTNLRTNGYMVPSYESIAYKFLDESAITTVVDIEWNLTRTGRYVPVAIVEPVELAGATIQRVTMNNADFLQESMAGVGSKIEIVRSNMVIPMITHTLLPIQPDMPQYCPVCGILFTKHGPDLICANQNCSHKQEAIVRAILNHTVPDGIGEITITKIIETYDIQDLSDLKAFAYGITQETDFGPHYAGLILAMAETIRNLKLTPGKVMQLANIPQVGNKVRENIDTNINRADFMSMLILGMPAPHMAEQMNAPAYKNLCELWARVEAIVEFVGKDNVVSPETLTKPKMRVTITGALSIYRREFVELLNVEEVSISKAQVLIANSPSNSSKYRKAVERGIPIMTEDEFRAEYR